MSSCWVWFILNCRGSFRNKKPALGAGELDVSPMEIAGPVEMNKYQRRRRDSDSSDDVIIFAIKCLKSKLESESILLNLF